ncbi:MAG TPA: GNAT family N-acetyltransferase [Patescibacteria group bacterium]|nr:GNAT family N-acetyltransferase [Patescibacteria group bacterium]
MNGESGAGPPGSGGPGGGFAPVLPAIPGLVVRPWRGDADFGPMAEARNAAFLTDGLDETTTGEILGNEIRHDPRLNPTRDISIVELAGAAVGYAVRWRWVEEASGDAVLSHRCYLALVVRRRGVGRAILRANEASLAAESLAPTAGDGRRWFETWADDGAAGARALLAAEGYEPARWFFLMLRPSLEATPDVPPPPGIEVRPVRDRAAAWPVMRADDEAFRDHWGYRPTLPEEIEGYLDDPRQDLALWQVAWDGDEVAGSVLPLIDAAENERFGRRRGWIDSVSVRRPWRRQGVARALLGRGLEALRERGMAEAVLGVDADNPQGALGLYESVGFELHRRSAVYRKPAPPAPPRPAAPTG